MLFVLYLLHAGNIGDGKIVRLSALKKLRIHKYRTTECMHCNNEITIVEYHKVGGDHYQLGDKKWKCSI